ncbi:hypothetical protein, partial [Shewanella mangrovisoli]|uniref:hypothetical protein n=1 Tax=Shewanella mangrovisoli TaxID=2864211 RepID=UPI0035B786AD
SEVKRNRADGSVGSPHVRVGHRQAPKYSRKESMKPAEEAGFFVFAFFNFNILFLLFASAKTIFIACLSI